MNVALGTLDHSRLGVAAQAVGIAQGAIDHAVAYANERKQFGQAISEFQGIQFKLADMETRTAAARELLYRACAKIDRHEPDAGKYSAMAKLFASDTAMYVTVEAVQVLGGYGYVNEYPVERYMRDAKITQIYEGTNEIQRARDRADASGSLESHAFALADRATDRLHHGALPRGRADRSRRSLQGLSPAGLAAARSRCSRSSLTCAAVAALVIGLIVGQARQLPGPGGRGRVRAPRDPLGGAGAREPRRRARRGRVPGARPVQPASTSTRSCARRSTTCPTC